MTEAEFEQHFKTYFTPLSNIAYHVVKDADLAKDLVQQVFVKLWQKKDQLVIKGQMKSYLHRAVVNTCLNYIESTKKLQSLETTAILTADMSTDSTSMISDEELKNSIRKAVEQLPEKCGLVFSLSRFSGMKNDEIADYLDVSIKSVEKHIGKALKQLRVTLEPLYNNLLVLMLFLFVSEVGFLLSKLSLT